MSKRGQILLAGVIISMIMSFVLHLMFGFGVLGLKLLDLLIIAIWGNILFGIYKRKNGVFND
ncbi:hypothetical protein [Viridibacillus arvi]|uniref:hypothetical protein n=1 Tax=Viridibacillus arvi TaxID=263475 RepID=UPI00187BBC08|nr:hypothetical protein [Viridibacillus sp. JNUCC-6]QOV11189.1 hypothetical protein JNUCC6_21985 [Viridibacillus sp. JNUCC-6]